MGVLVSVILPIYNTINSLDRCIQSILNQTLKSLELIIINDGSTDGSGKMADTYASKDDRIHVIHQENAGVDAARNAGIAVAKGAYLAFVDSDDYADEKLYETLYNAAQESKADIVSCSMYRIWENKSVLVESKDRIIDMNEAPRAPIIDRCVFGDYKYRISVWGKFYKKSMIDQYEIWYWGKRMGDALFNIKALMVAGTVQILSAPLYFYHKRPGSITTTTVADPLYPIRHVSMVKQIQDFGVKHNILNRIDSMLPQYYLRFLKSALISVEDGNTYAYIYFIFKKLYREDRNFKKLLSHVKASEAKTHTLKRRMWALYRRFFTWTCSHGWLKIAAFLYWRQQKPWEPEI